MNLFTDDRVNRSRRFPKNTEQYKTDERIFSKYVVSIIINRSVEQHVYYNSICSISYSTSRLKGNENSPSIDYRIRLLMNVFLFFNHPQLQLLMRYPASNDDKCSYL